MTNIRITEVTPTVESEALAPRTTIFWEPTSNTGSVHFECQRFYRTTGTTDYFGAPEPDGGLSLSLADLMTRTVTVQTPNGPMDIPAALLMGAVKALFDELYVEQRTPAVVPEPVAP
jgi:hypothetical protein